MPYQAGRQDPGVVQDDEVAWVEVSAEGSEGGGSDRAIRAAEDEEAGVGAVGEGMLGDALGWERVIEVVGAHVGVPVALT